MTLVTSEEFKDVCVNKIRERPEAIAFDFETTGLSARKGDTAFLVGVAFSADEVYSHFITSETVSAFRTLFSSRDTRYLAHNAKFEMAFLDVQFGIQISGDVWDTEVMAKLMYNNHFKYSLQACAERMGNTKYKPMADWIKKNGHFYDKAPRDIIVPYVEQDARLSYLLYLEQRDMFREWQRSSVPASPTVALDIATTKNLYAMERTGIRVDVSYCRQALDYELQRIADSAEEFKRLTGVEFVDSRKTLAPVFDSLKIPYNHTPKGNASFNYESMKPYIENPIVAAILQHRDATKRSSTYWQNFLDLEINGRIHPDIRQSGAAATGRMSAASPNVQNWTDDSEDPSCAYPIRRAFVADHGCKLVSIDYAQMELRLMADEAEEFEMITAIKNGTDFHQQVADAACVPRGIAKNARFA
jgi:DNA polymerase-1